jgi:hypothetical protein
MKLILRVYNNTPMILLAKFPHFGWLSLNKEKHFLQRHCKKTKENKPKLSVNLSKMPNKEHLKCKVIQGCVSAV